MNASGAWTWSAWGKHPVVKDYIALGGQTPVGGAFSRWVEEGYAHVRAEAAQRSWRFFAKGCQPREIACGLLRDSFDAVGRPFPFLVVGLGPLEGWEEHWVHLPEAFDGVWERLEFISTRRMASLDELKADVRVIPRPVLKPVHLPVRSADGSAQMNDAGGGVFSMKVDGSTEHGSEIARALQGLRSRLAAAPEAVFIGGLPEQSFLVAFSTRLKDSDFIRLWTMRDA